MDNDSQKLPLVTFLKLLTERKKVPMSCQLNLCSWQQCSDLCSSPFPALSTSLLYFEADERGLDFRRKEGVHHFHRRLIIFFFDSGIPDCRLKGRLKEKGLCVVSHGGSAGPWEAGGRGAWLWSSRVSRARVAVCPELGRPGAAAVRPGSGTLCAQGQGGCGATMCPGSGR